MKKTMSKFSVSVLFSVLALFSLRSSDSISSGYYDGYGDEEEVVSKIVAKDIYDLKIKLKVPQVRNNSNSTGTRKMESQTISGQFIVLWKEDGTFSFDTYGLYNRKFKVGGKNVTYKGYAGDSIIYPRFNYIGNNKTGKFKVPCLSFSLVLEPSYAIDKVNEDNSFYLVLSGNGTSTLKNGCRIAKKIKGNVAGSQGCGCSDYGHKSPTREASVNGFSNNAADVVSTYGTWSIIWRRREYK